MKLSFKKLNYELNKLHDKAVDFHNNIGNVQNPSKGLENLKKKYFKLQDILVARKSDLHEYSVDELTIVRDKSSDLENELESIKINILLEKELNKRRNVNEKISRV